MIERLSANRDISAWILDENKISAYELFISGAKADMLRAKDITDYAVTVYVDQEKTTRGDSSFSAFSSESDDMLDEKIAAAVRAAKSVKNPWYPLADPLVDHHMAANYDSPKILQAIAETVLNTSADDAAVNSFEVFVETGMRRITHSEGLDVSYPFFKERMELITEAEGSGDPVEVYCLLDFKDLDGVLLKRTLAEKLEEAALRAGSTPTPRLENMRVILSGGNVRRFFQFFVEQAQASMAYRKMTTFQIGDRIDSQDPITLTLRPMMASAASARPYDNDGVRLEDTEIIKNSIIRQMHGSLQYSYYMGIEPSGRIDNFEVAPGAMEKTEESGLPYLEVLAFSDFIMNPLTGEFGGEIRLAKYFDGTSVRPVSGGSLSGVISDVLPTLRLSNELQERNGFIGPRFVSFDGMTVMGETTATE